MVASELRRYNADAAVVIVPGGKVHGVIFARDLAGTG